MTITRKLLDSEADTKISADHSLDLTLVLLGFLVVILIVAWRWRAILFQEWIVFFNGGLNLSSPPPPPPGLKNTAKQLLPSATYISEVAKEVNECAICLTEFVDGDLTRQCRHMFHVVCVDKWLKTHSSCPSCRRLVTVMSKKSASIDVSGKNRVNGNSS